jgi:hypothetical protein
MKKMTTIKVPELGIASFTADSDAVVSTLLAAVADLRARVAYLEQKAYGDSRPIIMNAEDTFLDCEIKPQAELLLESVGHWSPPLGPRSGSK